MCLITDVSYRKVASLGSLHDLLCCVSVVIVFNIVNLFVSFSLPVLDKSFEEQIFEVNCRMKVIEGGNRELI